jgi:hypothetical protein
MRGSPGGLSAISAATREPRDDDPEDAAEGREHRTLREQLADDTTPSCAERRPHRELAATLCTSSEQEIDDVDARNDEHERNRSEDGAERGFDATRDLVL